MPMSGGNRAVCGFRPLDRRGYTFFIAATQHVIRTWLAQKLVLSSSAVRRDHATEELCTLGFYFVAGTWTYNNHVTCLKPIGLIFYLNEHLAFEKHVNLRTDLMVVSILSRSLIEDSYLRVLGLLNRTQATIRWGFPYGINRRLLLPWVYLCYK